MGKKSSTKKNRKEQLKVAEQSEPQEKSMTLQRIAAMGMVVVSLVVLAFVSIFVWARLTRARPIAEYLEPGNTLAVVEMDTQWSSPEWKDFFSRFKNSPSLQEQAWIGAFQQYTQLDFQKYVEPWIGRRVGIAFLRNFSPAFFLETKDRDKAVAFVEQFKLSGVNENLIKQNYKGVTIYSFAVGQGAAIAFLGNYLVIAPDTSSMQQIIAAKTQGGTLYGTDIYHNVTDNLPTRNLAFAFMNTEFMFQQTLGNELKSNPLRSIIQPVLEAFQAQGWTAKMVQGDLVLENFITLSQKKLEGKPLVKFEKKYHANLTSFLPSDIKMFYGSRDLKTFYGQLSRIFSEPVMKTFVETSLRKYFGKQMNVEEFFGLFENEYAIAKSGTDYDLVLRLTDEKNQELTIRKFIQNLKMERGIFTPVINGDTVSGNSGAITDFKETYRNFPIQGLQIEGKPWGIYYTIIGNTAVFSSSDFGVKQSIDVWTDQKDSFASEYMQTEKMKSLLESSDEVFFAKKDWLVENVPESYKNIVEPFGQVSVGWNYFDDGIKSIIRASPTHAE